MLTWPDFPWYSNILHNCGTKWEHDVIFINDIIVESTSNSMVQRNKSNEHNHYVYINTTTCVEAHMQQIPACALTLQGPARPECSCWKHKMQFVPFLPKSGSFSSFSGIRSNGRIFRENPVGLANMLGLPFEYLQIKDTHWDKEFCPL